MGDFLLDLLKLAEMKKRANSMADEIGETRRRGKWAGESFITLNCDKM